MNWSLLIYLSWKCGKSPAQINNDWLTASHSHTEDPQEQLVVIEPPTQSLKEDELSGITVHIELFMSSVESDGGSVLNEH